MGRKPKRPLSTRSRFRSSCSKLHPRSMQIRVVGRDPEGRITAAYEAVAKRIEIVCWICLCKD